METPEQEPSQDETATEAVPEDKIIDLDEVRGIINSFPSKSRQFLIPMMSKIQAKFRFLPEEIVQVLIKELKVTRAEIYGVISFYHQFRITEPGKYIFKLCYGTACFVKGAPIIADKLKEKYNIGQGETDASKLFTLEFASCLGNCGAAPMAIIGDDTHGTIDPEKTYEVCSEYKL